MIEVSATGQATATDVLTLEQVKARITAVAEARPEHVGVMDGGSCTYFDGEAPSCIVGHAFEAEFRQLSIPVDDIDGDVFEVVSDGKLPMTEAAMNYALRVQQVQDDSTPWGEAVAEIAEVTFDHYDDTDVYDPS